MNRFQITLISIIIALALFGIEFMVLKGIYSETKEEVKIDKKPKLILTESGERINLITLHPSKIKRLEIENGFIYFTDKWAILVNNRK